MFTQNGEWVTILRIRKYLSLNWLYSIRFHLVIILVVFGLLPALVMKTVLINAHFNDSVKNRTAELKNQSTILTAGLGKEDLLSEIYSDDFQSKITELAHVYDGRILILDQEYKVLKDSFETDLGKTLLSSNAVKASNGKISSSYSTDDHSIVLAAPILSKTDQSLLGIMVMSSCTDMIIDHENDLKKLSDIVICGIMIVVLLLAIPIGTLVTRPLRKMRDRIMELYHGHSTEELKVDTYTETKQISDAFNMFYRRMRAVDASRQEFVANVSHELKTPLTSLKILSDSLIYQEHVPEELYREFLLDMSEEVDRENKIINDLLELVKMDRRADVLMIQKENVNEILERILWRLKPIAKQKSVELVFESNRPVVADVDEAKLSLAFMNILENAIKYNKEEGWVHVKLDADHRYFTIEVSDSGIGIPKDEQEHIFERFYRVDKSHSREIGGTGLGLSIARNAVLMHRGTIQLNSEEGNGTTFVIRIPNTYVK